MSLNNFTYSVSWSDFSTLQSRPTKEDSDAFIKVTMGYKYDYDQKGRSTVLTNLNVDIAVLTNSSWVVEDKKTDYLLKHEQGHYDIFAISAREFYNSAEKLTATSPSELDKKVKQLHAKFDGKQKSVNKRYDAQTKHSDDKSKQGVWDKAINDQKQKPSGSIDNLPQ